MPQQQAHRFLVQAALMFEVKGSDMTQARLNAVKRALPFDGHQIEPGVVLTLGPTLVVAIATEDVAPDGGEG